MPIRNALSTIGWRIRSRNRADCRLCRGHSTGTLAFTDRLWKCHRCGAGGDVFTLIRAVQHCGFRDALRFVAELGGLQPNRLSGSERRELAQRKEQRERIDIAAESLKSLERTHRIRCRNHIHRCDRVLSTPGPWSDSDWQRARAAQLLRDEFLLPEFTLLAFGALPERTRYLLADHLVRAKVVTAVRAAGGIRSDGGHWVEVIGS